MSYRPLFENEGENSLTVYAIENGENTCIAIDIKEDEGDQAVYYIDIEDARRFIIELEDLIVILENM